MSRRPIITATYQQDMQELTLGAWTDAKVVQVTPGIDIEVTFELHDHNSALALLDRAVADIRAQIEETDQ